MQVNIEEEIKMIEFIGMTFEEEVGLIYWWNDENHSSHAEIILSPEEIEELKNMDDKVELIGD